MGARAGSVLELMDCMDNNNLSKNRDWTCSMSEAPRWGNSVGKSKLIESRFNLPVFCSVDFILKLFEFFHLLELAPKKVVVKT